MTTARVAATRALVAITDNGIVLGTAIDAERRVLPDARDRALALEITTGALRWRAALDFVIEDASGRSLQSIDRTVLAVLRIAAYQLRHLDRVPEHAVVSESVEAARVLGSARAAGFVNAVLRQMIRRHSTVRLPRPASPDASREAQLAYLSTTLSHPRWLAERWLDRVGYDACVRWCEWNNGAPAITVRAVDGTPIDALLTELRSAGHAAEHAPFVEDAVRLSPGVLGRLDASLRNRLWVQDEGAQLVARAAGVSPGERVLDLCASPGGKSIVLGRDMSRPATDAGLLVSADYRRARVSLLARTLRQFGPAAIVRLNAREPLPFGPVFDRVLADVPCSGLGTLRRDPDLKWSRTADDLPAFVAGETRILEMAASAVRPGGRLVYATCSSETEENHAVVDAFLERNADFHPAGLPDAIPTELVGASGRLETRPGRDGLDAFFAAVLVRR